MRKRTPSAFRHFNSYHHPSLREAAKPRRSNPEQHSQAFPSGPPSPCGRVERAKLVRGGGLRPRSVQRYRFIRLPLPEIRFACARKFRPSRRGRVGLEHKPCHNQKCHPGDSRDDNLGGGRMIVVALTLPIDTSDTIPAASPHLLPSPSSASILSISASNSMGGTA